MFDCFKSKVEESTDYPKQVYSVYYTHNGIIQFVGVYEIQEDAKQFCINNTNQAYFMVTQSFNPPIYPPCCWPKYAYPMYYTDNKSHIVYTFAEAFVSATDAGNYMTTNSNANISFGYENCYYYPAGSLSLTKSKSTMFETVAPHSVVLPDENNSMKI